MGYPKNQGHTKLDNQIGALTLRTHVFKNLRLTGGQSVMREYTVKGVHNEGYIPLFSLQPLVRHLGSGSLLRPCLCDKLEEAATASPVPQDTALGCC